MTITIKLLPDFSSIPPYVIYYILVVLLLLVVLCYRLAQILNRWVIFYGQRKGTSIVWPSSPVANPVGQSSQTSQEVGRERRSAEIVVPQVSPEAVLKRAPKPTGFASSNHGDKQQGSTNSQSSD